mmetsp:Transcript_18301/g.43026  ORF Transcript_18301/g.43026 Transcript_18301/m.43026 type:complete len:120 (+) Transcript_18301:79-438(+)
MAFSGMLKSFSSGPPEHERALWCKTSFSYKGKLKTVDWCILDNSDKVTQRVRAAFSIPEKKLVYFEDPETNELADVDDSIAEGKSLVVMVEPPDFTFTEFFNQFQCILGKDTGRADRDI